MLCSVARSGPTQSSIKTPPVSPAGTVAQVQFWVSERCWRATIERAATMTPSPLFGLRHLCKMQSAMRVIVLSVKQC